VANGIFTKTYSMIRYEKIQQMQINDSFVSKITKLKKSTVFILASLLHSAMPFPLMEEEILEQIAKKMIEAS
jgi:hypothetical protein